MVLGSEDRRATRSSECEICDGHNVEGKLCLAISIDIKNAFNSLPWGCIVEALISKEVPFYLVNIVMDYLSDRSIIAVRVVEYRVPTRCHVAFLRAPFWALSFGS
ncbi:hypothetical protein P5V15_015352 [Pogonomyrmex californicus]